MGADGWSGDADLSRWEALEAEAKESLDPDGGERVDTEAPTTDPEPQGPAADWDVDGPSWWQDPEAEEPARSVAAFGGADLAAVGADAPDAEPSGPAADILLADADNAVGASLEQAMTDRGWAVRRVLTGDAALAEFQRQAPDCFVFDYSLPGIAGLDLLRHLAESGLADDTRLVVNSAQTQAIHVQRARAMGANRFLDRPLRSPDRVVEAVAGQLEEVGVIATGEGERAALRPMDQAPPPEPEPVPGGPGRPAGGLFPDGAAPRGPVNDDRPEVPTPSAGPPPTQTEGDRPYRSAFGSGGGPPGRVPKLGRGRPTDSF